MIHNPLKAESLILILKLACLIIIPLGRINSQKGSSYHLSAYYTDLNIAIFERENFMANFSLVTETNNNYGLKVQFSNGYIPNRNKPNNYYTGFCFFGCGETTLSAFSILLRRVFYNKSRIWKFGIDIGPVINQFGQPQFSFVSSPCFICSNYKIKYVYNNNLGLIIKTNILLIPGRFIGFNVGGIVNINRERSFAAFECGWSTGLVKRKIFKELE